MNKLCFIFLILNALVYVLFLIIYQFRKKVFDIGTILLTSWTIGSIGSVYYYTFEVAYLSYYKITITPLVYLFFINYLLFKPFLHKDYKDITIVNTYNLDRVLNTISIFFSIITIPALLDLTHKITSFSMASAALAEMYASDEDRVTLIFSPIGKMFYSILRHFVIFIIFLFFFQLSRKKINKLIVFGLGLNIITFFLVSLLSGSRGGIVSLLLMCAYFLFMLRNLFQPKVFKLIMKTSYLILGMIVLGIGMISVSRLTDMGERKGREQLMDQWIAQYAGEGIIQYDNIIWHIDSHLHGKQNLPYLYSFTDSSVKDLDKYTANAENIVKTPVTIFYTYVGDMILDFGIIGSVAVFILMFYIIKYLIRTQRGYISFYHLIILAYFFQYLSIGFTANIFRTYYTQISIIETMILLSILYIFQKLNEKKSKSNSNKNFNTSI